MEAKITLEHEMEFIVEFDIGSGRQSLFELDDQIFKLVLNTKFLMGPSKKIIKSLPLLKESSSP